MTDCAWSSLLWNCPWSAPRPPVAIRKRPVPEAGRIPQAGRSTTSRPDSLGGPRPAVAIANPQVARFLSPETRPDRFQSMSFHATIQPLRCGVRRRHLDRASIEANLFAASRDVGTGRVRGVGNPLALRLALRRRFIPVAKHKTILYRLYNPTSSG